MWQRGHWVKAPGQLQTLTSIELIIYLPKTNWVASENTTTLFRFSEAQKVLH